MRFSWPHPMMLLLISALCTGGVFFMLSACRGAEVVKVNPQDPESPQYPYFQHEFYLLQLTVDDIQELEKKQQYGKIYDEYASDAFKKSVSRRHFLMLANCAEEHLGALTEYDSGNLGFNRSRQSSDKTPALDSIIRGVQRAKKGDVREQLVFTGDGLQFKLNGLYWIADDPRFLKCVQTAEKKKDSPGTPISEEVTAPAKPKSGKPQ